MQVDQERDDLAAGAAYAYDGYEKLLCSKESVS
jgi:hypothetical protein